jgi:hypothetical protein
MDVCTHPVFAKSMKLLAVLGTRSKYSSAENEPIDVSNTAVGFPANAAVAAHARTTERSMMQEHALLLTAA